MGVGVMLRSLYAISFRVWCYAGVSPASHTKQTVALEAVFRRSRRPDARITHKNTTYVVIKELKPC